MRVGFDGRSLSSPAGGVRRYAGELLQALRRVAPDLQLVVFGAPDAASLPAGIESRLVPRVVPTNLGWSLADFPRAARHAAFDLFHAPAYTAPPRGARPLVLTIHDVSYERRPEWYPYRRDPLRRWFYRRSALAADRVITDSEFSRTEIQAAYGIPAERIRVVPLGVGPPFSRGPDDQPLPDGVREPYLLHVGDLHPRRNLPLLVRAAGRVAGRSREGHRLSIVLAGTDRGERARLVDQAAGSHVNVVFTAPADDRTLARLYRSAAAFVYVSHYEGFGLPLLEAMACGVPVVAARAASIPEVVGDAGVLVETSGEEDTFAAAISRVLDDAPFAETLRRAGIARAAAFSWDRTARMTHDVYRELAD
jgi:glycosyltransferase involved in cell wall biosynthesis